MSRRAELWLLAACAVVPQLFFLDAAVSIDAPVFVAVAEQVAAEPFDPFGFDLVWDPTSLRVAEFNHNPPLLSYWLAPFAAASGSAEWALHLAIVPLSLAAAFAFLGIARRLAPGGSVAAFLLVASPAYQVLASTLLLDVPVLAALLVAVYALLRANEGVRPAAWQWLCGLAVAAAGLTKYVGFSALPLLAAGLVLLPGSAPRRMGDVLRVVGVPLAVWSLWGAWTHALYGQVHFLGGVALVGDKSFGPLDFFNQALSLPVYYGLALGTPLFVWFASLRRDGRGTELAVAGALAGAAAFLYVLPEGLPSRRAPLDWEEGVLGTLGFAGALLVWGLGLWRGVRGDATDRFLALWAGGFLVFSWFVNWHVNAADALMASPPALLLLFRHELRPERRPALLWTGLMLGVSLLLTWVDVEQRGAYRRAARLVAAEIGDAPGARWSVGQWGFQYYLAREGFEPVRAPQYRGRFALSGLQEGDWLATARNVSQLDVAAQLNAYELTPVRVWKIDGELPLRTTNPDAAGGFYSHQSGFVPFSWSRAPLEEIGLARVTRAPAP